MAGSPTGWPAHALLAALRCQRLAKATHRKGFARISAHYFRPIRTATDPRKLVCPKAN